MAQQKSYKIDTSKSYEDLLKDYRRMAKTADQRLVRLESYSNDPYFATATKWSYARAMRDIQAWDGEEAKRFNTSPPPTKRSLIAKMKDIETFLESKTSTKRDIINVYKRRADTINKNYGTKFTWQSMAKYYESADAEKADKIYGSKTLVKAIAVIQSKGKKAVEAIQKADDSVIMETDDKMVQEVVNYLLKDKGFDVNNLFK